MITNTYCVKYLNKLKSNVNPYKKVKTFYPFSVLMLKQKNTHL